jgi:uncharacterized protein YbjT (DUF2867 family)
VFVTGATGYIGRCLIPLLQRHGHRVTALVRNGSQHKLASDCDLRVGDALNGDSYAKHVSSFDTFIHLVRGTASCAFKKPGSSSKLI